LLLGLAATQHRKSLILRKEATQLKELVQQSFDLIGQQGKFNGSSKTWRDLPGGRSIELGGCPDEKAKQRYKGRAHDLKCFDEVSDFTESQYTFISAWTRTVTPGQRCRIVAAGNPPMTAEGEWVVRRWAPWLDAQHPNPAKPGELRWYAMVENKEVECEGPATLLHKGESVVPRSRTFIPARLTDNPALMATGYATTLQNLPEPMRSMLLYGDFRVGREDDAWQVIPTEWVRLAQTRWRPDGGAGRPLTCLGVDPARGGGDKTVLAPRHGAWFGPLLKHPGKSTPDGPAVVGIIKRALADAGEGADSATVHIDVIGVGSSVYDLARQAKVRASAVNNAEGVNKRDRSRTLEFANFRAWSYWSLREALDPVSGEGLALPPDPELLADLCAARWKHQASGVLVEPKENIVKRLGRSPDAGDAVVMAHLPPRGSWKAESF
jgi:hypothetical protein